jgi:hypothetical protein
MAQVCLKTWGDTRFAEREAQRVSATRTYFLRMYSKPARVIHPSRALTKSSGADGSPRTDNQARNAEAVSRHIGIQRSLRPFPCIRTVGSGWNLTSATRMPTSSDTRNPPAKQRCSMARSRIPSRYVGSGAFKIDCISCAARWRTRRESVFLIGIERTL